MEFVEYVKIRHEKFGSVIFDTLREKVFVTNTQGADILKLIQEGKGVDEISEALGSIYEYDSPLLSQDVRDFLEEMRSNNLIPFGEGASAQRPEGLHLR